MNYPQSSGRKQEKRKKVRRKMLAEEKRWKEAAKSP